MGQNGSCHGQRLPWDARGAISRNFLTLIRCVHWDTWASLQGAMVLPLKNEAMYYLKS